MAAPGSENQGGAMSKSAETFLAAVQLGIYVGASGKQSLHNITLT